MAVCDVVKSLQDLQLSEKAAVYLSDVEETYVLDIAVQPSSYERPLLAATSSNYTIRLFSQHSLAAVGNIKGHTNVITGVCFGRREPDLLYSSSTDKTIRCWDTRTDLKKAVQTFQGTGECNNLFASLDVNATDQVLCAGLEVKKNGDDAYILFWDRRKAELLGCYSESHEDDITQVCFHPTNSDSLATGSTDGLVCVFDISQTTEDDALLSTLNSQSSVARLGWCGEDWKEVYCCTHIDTYHRWDALESEPLCEITDLKDRLQGKDTVDYLVNALTTDTGDTYLVTGTHSGEIRVIEVKSEDDISMVTRLSGGHNSTVRCMVWNQQTGTLVSGGEDSMLCLWSSQADSTDSKQADKSSKVKLKKRKSVTKRKKPYEL